MPYCLTCLKTIKSLGIASHRAWHRRRGENCEIKYASGTYVVHDFGVSATSNEEAHILAHSLGAGDQMYRAVNGTKGTTKLPKDFYRNRFCTTPGTDNYELIQTLVAKGFMRRLVWGHAGDSEMYAVTSDGVIAMKKHIREALSTRKTQQSCQ